MLLSWFMTRHHISAYWPSLASRNIQPCHHHLLQLALDNQVAQHSMAPLSITSFLNSGGLPTSSTLEHTSTATSTLRARGLSTDNTINIIFGTLTAILSILSVVLAWAMWNSSHWTLAGRGPQDDSRWYLIGAIDSNSLSSALPRDIELQPIAGNHYDYEPA